MLRASLFSSFVLLGACTTSYVSVTGRVYESGSGAMTSALLESASVDLKCPANEIRSRILRRHRTPPLLVAEGCRGRVFYVLDCSLARNAQRNADQVRTRDDLANGGVSSEPPPSTRDAQQCELVLLSRVELD